MESRDAPNPEIFPAAALGLGLCDSLNLLTPEELQQLNEDLMIIAKTRRQLPEHWDNQLVD